MQNTLVTLADRAPQDIPHRSFIAYRGQHRAIEKTQQKNGKKMMLRKVDYTQYYPQQYHNKKDVRFIVNIES